MDLTEFFDLHTLGRGHFTSVAQCPNFRGGLFGGQLLAHAMSAAAASAGGRPVHSLHTQFLKAGNASEPLHYRVKCLRHGRSFSHFQVWARQHRQLVALMLIACHELESGFSHQEIPPPLPPPADSADRTAPPFELDSWLAGKSSEGPLEFVFAQGGRLDVGQQSDEPAWCWLRVRAPLAPSHQLPALAFMSDLGILAGTLIPHPTHLFHRELSPASLNHTLWIHQPQFDLSQWHLLKLASPWAGLGRGLGHSYLFDRHGVLIATAAQEGLIRAQASAAKQ